MSTDAHTLPGTTLIARLLLVVQSDSSFSWHLSVGTYESEGMDPALVHALQKAGKALDMLQVYHRANTD